MPQSNPESPRQMATRLEDLAAVRIAAAGSNKRVDSLAEAQAAATLALALRVRDLTGALEELLGDDSHLDGLKVAVRDGLPFAGKGDG